MSESPFLQVKELSKSYGNRPVLQGVSFEVRSGEFYALLGENGAGKSTLLKVLMNQERTDFGEILYFGRTCISDMHWAKSQMGFISEDIQFVTGLPLQQFIPLYSNFHSKWNHTIVDESLKRSGIGLNQKIESLSRGQKIQVALTLALASQPKLILVDEATAVLDPDARKYYLGLLSKHTQTGGSVVMATNILGEMDGIATHALAVQDHKLVMNFSISEMKAKFIKVRIPVDLPIPDLLSKWGVWIGKSEDNRNIYVMAPDRPIEWPMDWPIDWKDRRAVRIEEIYLFVSRFKAHAVS